MTIAIPRQDEWMNRGKVLGPGPVRSWDYRLYGMVTPRIIKFGHYYALFYIGADGDRVDWDDTGPRHRALGVALSTDGVHFNKHPYNPVYRFSTLDDPHLNQEEGIFSMAGYEKNGKLMMYVTTTIAESAQHPSNVHGAIRLLELDYESVIDRGVVLSYQTPWLYGKGDEISVYGTFKWGPFRVLLYRCSDGKSIDWHLGAAVGVGSNWFFMSKAIFPFGAWIGGGDSVKLGDDRYVFLQRGSDINATDETTEVRKVQGRTLAPSGIRYTFKFGQNRQRHQTVMLDEENDRWLMYYQLRRENWIGLRTAPVRRVA